MDDEEIRAALETLRAARDLRDALPRESRDRDDIVALLDELAEALHDALIDEPNAVRAGRLHDALAAAQNGVVRASASYGRRAEAAPELVIPRRHLRRDHNSDPR